MKVFTRREGEVTAALRPTFLTDRVTDLSAAAAGAMKVTRVRACIAKLDVEHAHYRALASASRRKLNGNLAGGNSTEFSVGPQSARSVSLGKRSLPTLSAPRQMNPK
jgi:hypothetical protein